MTARMSLEVVLHLVRRCCAPARPNPAGRSRVVVDQGPGPLLGAQPVEDRGAQFGRHAELIEDLCGRMGVIAGQADPLVPVHAGKSGVRLDQGQQGPFPLDQQHVAHMTGVFERRPHVGLRPAPEGRLAGVGPECSSRGSAAAAGRGVDDGDRRRRQVRHRRNRTAHSGPCLQDGDVRRPAPGVSCGPAVAPRRSTWRSSARRAGDTGGRPGSRHRHRHGPWPHAKARRVPAEDAPAPGPTQAPADRFRPRSLSRRPPPPPGPRPAHRWPPSCAWRTGPHR